VEQGDQIFSYLQAIRDPDQFRQKPWQEDQISPSALKRQIERAIEQHGCWDTYGELRMGAGPVVRIEPVDGDTERSYLVNAEYGVAISGEFQTLDQALGWLSSFARFVWDLGTKMGTREGLIWRAIDLPWPPRPR